MAQGQTTAPPLLTEADLISLMDKHGIGTDATHADHIEMIKRRVYVGVQGGGFIPGHLGLGLVEAYDEMGFQMDKPQLRAELESDLKRICLGEKRKEEVLAVQLQKYHDIFLETERSAQALIDSVSRNFNNNNNPQPPPPGNGGGGGGGGDDNDQPPPPPPFGSGRGRGGGGLPQTGPNCKCGDATELKTTPSGKNQGRQFYACEKGRDAGCGFFEWVDSPGSPTSRLIVAGGQMNSRGPETAQQTWQDGSVSDKCRCGLPADSRVTKSGPNAGRPYLACSRGRDSGCGFFQWLDEPPASNTNSGSVSRAGVVHDGSRYRGVTADQPSCNCNLPAPICTSNKSGRQFYGCAKGTTDRGGCGFFKWVEDGRGPESSQAVSTQFSQMNVGGARSYWTSSAPQESATPCCQCQLPAVLRTVYKEGNNKGKKFFGCSKGMQSGCDFFKWSDEDSGNSAGGLGTDFFPVNGSGGFAQDEGSHPNCNCGTSARRNTVRKEGPNTGRIFFACPRTNGECKFFQWGDQQEAAR